MSRPSQTGQRRPSAPQTSLRRQSSYGKPVTPNEIAPPLPNSASSALYGGWTPTSNTPTSATQGMDRRKSKVDGMLFKKRQSVSYAHAQQQPQFGGNAPALPSIPQHYQTNRGPPQAPPSVPVRYGDLEREGLDVDAYLERLLASNKQGTSLDMLKRMKIELQQSLETNAQHLQENVLSNYANFVTISKELSSLEHEMLELRAVLEQWRSVPQSLELPSSVADATTSDPARRANHRNSIADLNALHRTQLEALWDAVEGSQKFLPPVQGRSIIAESSAFTELNAATYKPRAGDGAVHLVLLSDAMLVATQRRRQMGSKLRLVADRCFALSEIVVVDLKDSGQLRHAVKIKRGKEAYIFCADRPDDKRNLLGAFKKVAEDMVNRKRKQSIWEAETRKDVGSNRLSIPGSSLPSFNPYAFFGLPGADLSGKDQSWIGDIADELTVHIASREFDEAINLIDRAKSAYPLMQADQNLLTTFRTKIDTRTANLIQTLLGDLHSLSVGKTGAIKAAGWLLRLGEADRSRETFLSGRATLVKRRVKQIKFEGNIGIYIGELAMVVFTLIKNTCEWYMAAFKDTKMTSGFVRWASQQVELFCEMYRRQVFGAEQDRTIIEDALTHTRSHALMLRDVGLDFSFMLDSLLQDSKR